MITLPRHNNTRFYLINNSQFFIYWKNNGTAASLVLDDNFIANQQNKWVLFFHDHPVAVENIKEASILKIMDTLIGNNNAAMLWVDDFTSEEDFFNNARRCILKGNTVTANKLAFEQDNQLKKYQFALGGVSGSFVSVQSNLLTFKRPAGENFTFKVNSSVCSFDMLSVDLGMNAGSIKYKAAFSGPENGLDIAIPYISKKRLDQATVEPVVTANFFSKENLAGCVLEATYVPFTASNKSVFRITSEALEEGVRTNLVDDAGFNLSTKQIADIEFSFSKIVVQKNNHDLNRFILYPSGGTITTDRPATLIGFSGTESITAKNTAAAENLVISFEPSKQMVVNESDVRLEELNSSLTSIISFSNKSTYYLDAERSPLFANAANSGLTNEESGFAAQRKEVPYARIEVGDIAASPALPVIPSLAFRNNPDLIEFDKVFVKLRMEEYNRNINANLANTKSVAANLQESSYVTPQGFLRSGQRLDFISRKNIDSNGIQEDVQFCIENVESLSDFNFSLTKEDVFFVLRPSMLTGPERVNINFKIRGFAIELTEFNSIPDPPANNDTFIIFKFSRHSFSELLKDPTRWSNYGRFKPDPAAAALLVREIEERIKFPSTPDYRYFNETIRKDANWNGIVVINIPIADGEQLPPVFDGLTGSQELKKTSTAATGKTDKRKFKTGMKFQYVAFPVNKTTIENGSIAISSTSFYGIIDYDLLNKTDGGLSDDYKTVSDFFPELRANIETYKFLLTKLLVRFENSAIRNFQSHAFLQLPDLFDNKIEMSKFPLEHPGIPGPDKKENFIRLDGQYQKNSADQDEFIFQAQSKLTIKFTDAGADHESILKSILVSRIGFNYSPGPNEFRFEIDAKADINSWSLSDLISIEDLGLQNIGFSFKLNGPKIPDLKFDLSRLLVFPKIKFNGEGFLSSFPIRFSHFECFKLTKISETDVDIAFDYFRLPGLKVPKIPLHGIANLFSFVFDFDLGTLGDLGGLKALKGQLLVGWSLNGGFAMGFKLNGPSTDGLHVDLFGAIKLDITKIEFCQIEKQFVLKILDARIKIYNVELPSGKEKVFNALIFAKPGEKTAWLFSYVKGNDPDPHKNKLLLGMGQRVGITGIESIGSVQQAVDKIKEIFDPSKNICPSPTLPPFYQKDRNWLIGSEAILPEEWPIVLKFIFNDPVLYGLHLGFKGEFLKGFSLDVLYKKLSENLGVYSTEIQLPDSLRNQEMGGASIRLPNIGIDIYTNGDWKVDVGFPANSNDWSRAGFIQLRTAPPLVGFFGIYIMKSKIASQTLFKGYISDAYSSSKLKIVQAGFAMRVGVGYYFNKGILHVGASITVYGILEGAFAFENDQKGLSKIFPDHFAVLGRMGNLAELVGYVDFGIIKASVYISLRTEFGLLMVYLGRAIEGRSKGLQPVIVYVEGEVRVYVSIKIGCVKIKLRFRAYLRFQYTIGGNSSGNSLVAFQERAALTAGVAFQPATITIPITGISGIPMIYLPGFSKINQGGSEQLTLVHTFMIPFFGKSVEDEKISFSKTNLLKDRILKPFFESLIKELRNAQIENHDQYETLRTVMLSGLCTTTRTGKPETVEVDITIADFLPTFINGINSGDKAVVDAILRKHFTFLPEELKPAAGDNSIRKAYEKELLLIPAPVIKKIRIVDKDNNVIHSSDTGFKLQVEGLVANDAGAVIETTINGITDYDDDTLAWMEKFYDEYKTQFFERMEGNDQLAGLANKDLRETIIVPEFFKLAALLTLEAFYQETNPMDKHDEYNPSVSIDAEGCFVYNGGKSWNPNNALGQIIGQLNYFYNSGLRLPFEDQKENTKSIYELLKQQEQVKAIPKPWDTNNVKISIDGKDITKDVFLDDAAKKEMLNFIDGFDGNFALSNLKKEFPAVNPVQFNRPFGLIPVSLAIQNTTVGDGIHRFFEIPARLVQQAQRNTRYAFELNYATYDKDMVLRSTRAGAPAPLPGLLKSLHVEMKVRKHTDRVLEIVNVYAKDLNLLNMLYNDQYPIQAIDMFFKPEVDASKPEAEISLTGLITQFTSILKTNLSTRTSPPLFDMGNDALTAAFDSKREYWDDSNNPDTTNFIRLAWEALTTNNGGYYFILDKDCKFPNGPNGNELTDGTIILSFAGDQGKIPAYFNTLKLPATGDIFKTLNDRTHYLFIDGLKLTEDSIADKEILEYHPVIPAHTMGFQVHRNRSVNTKENYDNYLPLEFSLATVSGAPILSAERVLPVMPTRDPDAVNENDESRQLYQHLTPLVTQDRTTDPLGRNIGRYSPIGKKFNLDISLRDVFGNRTEAIGNQMATAQYEHFYFDRLVPVEAWPLIRFTYWFDKFKNGKLLFTLSCKCDIREVIELAGIDRKYELKEEINGRNADDDQQTHAERLMELVPGLLNNLYTISAQLTDANTEAFINGAEASVQKQGWKSIVNSLIEKLESIITLRDGKMFMPDTNVTQTPDHIITIDPVQKLKNELRIEVTLQRKGHGIHQANDAAFRKEKTDHPALQDLIKPYVWDYSSTLKAGTLVKPLNPQASATSRLTDLNEAIRKGSNNSYCLGISSEWKQDAETGKASHAKTVYIINEAGLSSIRAENTNTKNEFSDKCYFGIRPFSNKLWSGDYTPSTNELPSASFSNIDLDKSLRRVLEKIDQLLHGKKLSKEIYDPAAGALLIKDIYNQLIGAKKSITDRALKNKIEWVMDKENKPETGEGLTKEFRDLLLSSLTGFYHYDGVVKTTLTGLEILESSHRLSLSLNPDHLSATSTRYSFVSSKINPGNNEWYVLFDQKENVNERIGFEILPAITHIEFDIRESDISEIQQSTWIQLLSPVRLKQGKCIVKDWVKIIREFPEKPAIIRHTAEQQFKDGDTEVRTWDIAKTGLWNYELALMDAYSTDDIIEGELCFEIAPADAFANTLTMNFEGFIAYWADEIIKADQGETGFTLWKLFVKDLVAQFDNTAFKETTALIPPKSYPFRLAKSGNNWTLNNFGNAFISLPDTGKLAIKAGPFNLFDKQDRVVSILPAIKALRNSLVENKVFRYETETVKAVSAAEPHIRYFKPIALKAASGFADQVFGSVTNPVIPNEMGLKATAKFLVDTAGKDDANKDLFPAKISNLPIVPVQQVECTKQSKPSVTDALFDRFSMQNGFAAFSITIYGGNSVEKEIPVFFADTVYKPK